jgi:very-short-patch-repair endonuclease
MGDGALQVEDLRMKKFLPPDAGEGQDGGMERSSAKDLRTNPTEADRILWQHLRLRQFGGHKFRRQQPLGYYVVDFACLEKRLVVEVDGGQHNTQIAYDEQRAAWIEAQGFRVLRFWNHEIMQNIEAVKEAIWRALQ